MPWRPPHELEGTVISNSFWARWGLNQQKTETWGRSLGDSFLICAPGRQVTLFLLTELSLFNGISSSLAESTFSFILESATPHRWSTYFFEHHTRSTYFFGAPASSPVKTLLRDLFSNSHLIMIGKAFYNLFVTAAVPVVPKTLLQVLFPSKSKPSLSASRPLPTTHTMF